MRRKRKMSDAEFAKWFDSRCEPEPNTGCFLWLGATDSKGYGHLSIRGKLVGAHRVAYAIARGVAVDAFGLIDHICNNPLCVSPDHLRELSFVENVRRRATTKLTMPAACAIRKRYATGCVSQRSLAEEYCVSQMLISRVVHHQYWIAQ